MRLDLPPVLSFGAKRPLSASCARAAFAALFARDARRVVPRVAAPARGCHSFRYDIPCPALPRRPAPARGPGPKKGARGRPSFHRSSGIAGQGAGMEGVEGMEGMGGVEGREGMKQVVSTQPGIPGIPGDDSEANSSRTRSYIPAPHSTFLPLSGAFLPPPAS
eukprot:gene16074-biopygen8423